MSREVCKHGVEVKYSDDRTAAWHPCNECVRDAEFPAVRQKEVEPKERRADWIRNNVARLAMECPHAETAVGWAEKIADELIARGYL